MRLYTHFAFETLSNTYLIGPREGGDAVLFDPAVFDVPLLELIEGMGYYVRSVVLTHVSEKHLDGLRTLRRVYDCTVYAAHASVLDPPSVTVSDDDELDICSRPMRVIALPGHGGDSVAYHVGGFLFPGTAMSAGECGPADNPYARALLRANIGERLLTLEDETVILPFRGPPSTVALEKKTFPLDEPPPRGASL